jgi:hypothetical protein
MVDKSLWDEEEEKKDRERTAKEAKLFRIQDFLSDICLMRDECKSISSFLDRIIPRIYERAENLEQEIDQDFQNITEES